MNSTLEAILAASVSFMIITLVFAFICFLCQSSANRRRRGLTGNRTVPNSQLSSIAVDSQLSSIAVDSQLSSIAVDESASFDPNLNRISMNELKIATKNFSPDLIIGDGSFGFVYKASLSDGATVAIKKLGPGAFQGFREFQAEMETLGKLHHRNIVRILGYCVSGADRVLIYEFIERGNLDEWLHETSPSNSPLPWPTRMKIINGVANGVSYLHQLETPIIHRDIKASNVLLDSEFGAHIADFGLARAVDASHSHVWTQVAGTMGYMPPEYRDGQTAATVRADVYSFGILMIEVATGERPNLPVVLEGKEVGLIVWARGMIAKKREMEMLDSKMGVYGFSETNVREYFRIASMCTDEVMVDRPVMGEVVDLLSHL